MKTSAPALLPILRSEAVGELLARLFVNPDRAWTLSELAGAAGVSLPTANREVSRMAAAGLLTQSRIGRSQQIRPNTSARVFEALQRLIVLTYGPVPVLEHALRDVDRIERAFVYGSWAARHEGIAGPEPDDVDVLAIGQPDPDEVYDAGEAARRRLGRLVNIRVVRPSVWADLESDDPFLRQVRASPLVPLSLDDER